MVLFPGQKYFPAYRQAGKALECGLLYLMHRGETSKGNAAIPMDHLSDLVKGFRSKSFTAPLTGVP